MYTYSQLQAVSLVDTKSKVYYQALILHRQQILKDIQETNQGIVARKLGLSQPELSILTNVLSLNIALTKDD